MNKVKFTRGAWLTVAIILLLSLWSTGCVLYYFTLATDGWFTKAPDTFGTPGFIYVENLLHAPSGLEPGDHVTGIAGNAAIDDHTFFALRDRWRAGNTFTYTVERSGSTLNLPVGLVEWEFAPALNYLVQQAGGISTLLGQLLFFGIAALAFFKHPGDHAARALLIYAGLFLFLSPITGIGQSSASAWADPTFDSVSGITVGLGYTVLFPAVLLQFALVFPHPKPIVRRHPFLEYLPYLIGAATFPFLFLGIDLAIYGWTILSIIGAIAILIHSTFTMRDTVSRAQLAWGVWGFILGTVMVLLSFLVTFAVVSGIWATILNAAANLSFSVLGITLGIAILRYRLFEIGILVRRTLTYTLVTGVLVIVFFASVIVLQQIFSGLTGSGQNDIITVLSTLGIAALFVPLRNRIQNEIDKRFNRKKYDAQMVLNDFANTVRDETDLEKLTGRLMQVVDETMQPKSLSVWLKRAENHRRTGT